MDRKPNLPLEIGVRRGGYNPNPPRRDPDFIPPAAGIPFDRSVAPAPVHTQGICYPIPPLELGVHRGGYNPNPAPRDPNFIPAPGGFPFEPLPAGEPRAHTQNGTHRRSLLPLEPGVRRGGYNPNPPRRDPNFVPAPVPLSGHEFPRRK